MHKIKYASGMWADTELLGWPDLTLWKNGNIKLVEVKYTDKLHFNQVNWFRNIAKPLGYDFSLLRVVDSKRK